MADEHSRGGVVITGASTGIGHACALHLTRIGFRVFAGVRREEDAARLTDASGGAIRPLMLDVTQDRQIEEAARVVVESLGGGRLAGLVNNAGVAIAGPLEFLPVAELRHQLEINTIGPVAVSQAFLPLLRAGHGRIVHIGSVGGLVAAPFIGPYSASKFALEAIADSMRMELRPWSIHVSIIEPGSIKTPIWERGRAHADRIIEELPARAHELYGSAIPKVREVADRSGKRGLPPEAVARMVARALTERNPKPRYLVGADARTQALVARLLPSRLRDRLILRFAGL